MDTATEVKYPKLLVRLGDPRGEGGNVYVIIGKVAKALRTVDKSASSEFVEKALTSHQYDEVLKLAQTYVTLTWTGYTLK